MARSVGVRQPAHPRRDEVLLQGPRVVAAGQQLLAPWSERVRFGMKKNGYHGGATLQEVVLPLGIFAPPDTASKLAGWREAALRVSRLVAMEGRDRPGPGVQARGSGPRPNGPGSGCPSASQR